MSAVLLPVAQFLPWHSFNLEALAAEESHVTKYELSVLSLRHHMN